MKFSSLALIILFFLLAVLIWSLAGESKITIIQNESKGNENFYILGESKIDTLSREVEIFYKNEIIKLNITDAVNYYDEIYIYDKIVESLSCENLVPYNISNFIGMKCEKNNNTFIYAHGNLTVVGSSHSNLTLLENALNWYLKKYVGWSK